MNAKPQSLYYPLQKALITLQAIEENDGELTPELSEQFTLTTEKLEERAESMIDTRSDCLMIIAEAKRKIERENAVIASTERVIALIDKGLVAGVELIGNFTAGTYKLSLTKSEATIVTDASLIPAQYLKPVVVPKTPERGEPDKAAIKKAIDGGELVAGAFVEKRSKIKIK